MTIVQLSPLGDLRALALVTGIFQGRNRSLRTKSGGLIVTLISLFDLTQQELEKLILGC